MAIGVLALALAALGLITASFVGRFAAARLFAVRDIGIFGPGRAPAGRSVPAFRRLGAHAGGPLGAYVLSVVLFLLAFQIGGETVATTIIEVIPETPAELSKLEDGDRITHIEGEAIADWEGMRQAIKRRPNLPTRVDVQRDGQAQTLEVTPNAEGMIGVKPVFAQKPMGLGRSLARAAAEPARIVHMLFISVVRISTGTDTPKFMGTGAVAQEVGRAHERGVADTLYLVALLAAYVWPVFVVLEVLLAAGMWRGRRHQAQRVADHP